ncbi:M56 family metallopeptidase [Gimesia chilikensis]|uniref:Regulatory protein BlaR1 n=1 Tax=Gimesia chilikensis TaxID=2605989 RepID=A0A517PWY3_9PLAN|nr:M56 family metallopeptidase [Gimesia chilikensis]QDT23888.1 Regulatory protein BlaR1 [Gimesia chilikensis]
MQTILQYIPFIGQPDFLLDLIIKSTVVLLVALVATRLLPQASAAVRHTVWSGALLAVLALIFVNGSMPKLTRPALATQETASSFSAPLTSNTQQTIPGSLPEISAQPADYMKLPAAGNTQLQNAHAPAASLPRVDIHWNAIWLTGVLVMLIRLALLQFRLHAFSRQCNIIAEGPLFDLLQQCRVELNCSQPVTLLTTDQRSLPMTWGVRRPSILLPREAQNWTEREVRCALLHELAHVARRDCLWQLLVQLTHACYWFHPLVWFASRKLYLEREHACDDIVLQHGTRASDYADQLLQVVSAFRSSRSLKLTAVSLAAESGFSRRLKSILQETRDRRPVSLRTRLALTFTFIALTGLLAILPVAFAIDASADLPQIHQVARIDRPLQTEAKITAPAKSEPSGGPDVPLKAVAQSQQLPAQTSVQEPLPEPPGKVMLRNGKQQPRVFEEHRPAVRSLNIVFAHDPGIGNYDGVVGRPQDIWNMVDLGTTAVDYTRYSDATPSTVRLRITRHDGEWGIQGQSGIFQGYIYHNCRCVDLQTRVLDLPGGKYKIYVFAHGDAPNQNAKIELKVGNRVIGQKATASDGTWNYRNQPYREGVQYVSFDFDIKTGQELTLTSFRADSDYSMFNAIQIVPQTNLPPAPQDR